MATRFIWLIKQIAINPRSMGQVLKPAGVVEDCGRVWISLMSGVTKHGQKDGRGSTDFFSGFD
jgi:hypothetical protein